MLTQCYFVRNINFGRDQSRWYTVSGLLSPKCNVLTQCIIIHNKKKKNFGIKRRRVVYSSCIRKKKKKGNIKIVFTDRNSTIKRIVYDNFRSVTLIMTSFCIFIPTIISNKYRKRKSFKVINYNYHFFFFFSIVTSVRRLLSVLMNKDGLVSRWELL